jgi:hypothetical protein
VVPGRGLEAQRIDDPNLHQRSCKQLGLLSDRAPDCNSASAGALACEIPSQGVAVIDQESSASDEVVDRVLLVLLHSGEMPLLTILAASADVSDGIGDRYTVAAITR